MSDISRRGFLGAMTATPMLVRWENPAADPTLAFEAVVPYCGTCGDVMARKEAVWVRPMSDEPRPWHCRCGDKMLPYFRKLR